MNSLVDIWSNLNRWWLHLLRKVLHWWVRARFVPEQLDDLQIDDSKPVIYILETHALSSLLILEHLCRRQGLPQPLADLHFGRQKFNRRYGALQRFRGLFVRRKVVRRSSLILRELLTQQEDLSNTELQIVPVTVFVGRAPDEEVSLTKILFSENWTVAGRLRRMLSLFINGRSTLVQFGQPLLFSELQKPNPDGAVALRKANRILRTHFRRVRTAAIGPDRSHRRTLIDSIIKKDNVQQAITAHASKQSIHKTQAEAQARECAAEIAANYSYTMIRASEILLSWFWHRIYRGLDIFHFKQFRSNAPGHAVIYVPCHRSHIDYLLLSFILFRRGFVPPHVAAGINLNLPILGSFLRRGGAFFLRRSFRNQALYAAVFHEYLSTLLTRGVHIEYFVEGTRSRTGRLLQPRAGMLSMTVKSYLQGRRKPLMFQPIYVGYEALVEGNSYQNELKGEHKRKESWRDLIVSVINILRRNYGRVAVSFAQPIMLDDLLEEHHSDWENVTAETYSKPAWINPVVDDLAERIMVNINRAAHVNPVNLLATCLLNTPQRALDEQDLLQLLTLYIELLPTLPYADEVTITTLEPSAIIEYGKELGIVQRREHSLGNIIQLVPRQTVLLTYFRNNIAHLLALPSLLASCFLHTASVPRERLIEICRSIYPLLRNELFLPWSDTALDDIIDTHLGLFEQLQLLKESDDETSFVRATGGSDEAYLLRLIAGGLLQTLERIYITVAVLEKNGSGKLDRIALEKLCQQSAERLSILYHYEAPEFSDRSLFKQLIEQMLSLELISRDDQNRFVFDQPLQDFNVDAKLILSKEMRHSILQLAPRAELPPVTDKSD